jgi:hypothetical protein
MNDEKPAAVTGPVLSEGLGPTPPLAARLRDWADETYILQDCELPAMRRDMAAAAAEIERLHSALQDYFATADAAWLEVCEMAAKHKISSMPILPGQAKALDKYNELRRAFGA